MDPAPFPSRRLFLSGLGFASAAAALRLRLPFGVPQEPAPIDGKQGLRVLGDRPLNIETPVTLLDDDFTPTSRFFVRNNGHLPARAATRDLTGWSLAIDGEVERPRQWTLDDLRQLPIVDRALVIECAGNGRAGFEPPATGNQWTLGGVGCARYRGVRLRDVLERCGVKSSAVYIGYYGEDLHLSGDPAKPPISRGVPIAKALDEHTLLVWEMNGEPLPALHGFPLRLICPGWPGSTSGKWLRRIQVRDREHDGAQMTGDSYRLPRRPVAPGTPVADADMAIIEAMPVKSIITSPASGIEHRQDEPLNVRGHAWSGHGDVTAMHLSFDFGQTWSPAELRAPVNRYAWQRFTAALRLPTPGYYEVWARATDESGRQQPMVVPGWNPKGYCNNAMHRIAVKVV